MIRARICIALAVVCLVYFPAHAHDHEEKTYWVQPIAESRRLDMLMIGYPEFTGAFPPSSPAKYYYEMTPTGGYWEYKNYASNYTEITKRKISYGGSLMRVRDAMSLDGWEELPCEVYDRHEDISPGDFPLSLSAACGSMPFDLPIVTVADGSGMWPTIADSAIVGRYAAVGSQCYEVSGGNMFYSVTKYILDTTVFTLSDEESPEDARAWAQAHYKANGSPVGEEARSYWEKRTGRTWSEQTATITFCVDCSMLDGHKEFKVRYRLEIKDLSTQATTYEIKTTLVKINDAGEPETPIKLPFEEGKQYTLVAFDPPRQLGQLELTPIPGCETCASGGSGGGFGSGRGGGGGPGTAATTVSLSPTGYAVNASLGSSQDGSQLGALSLGGTSLGVGSSSPGSLQVISSTANASGALQIHEDSTGFVQAVGPQQVTERVSVANGYELRIYPRESVTLQGTQPPYVISGGVPSEVVRITNPDGAPASNRLRVERVSGGHTTETMLTQNAATRTWTLVEGNGLRKTTRGSTTDPSTGNRIETKTISGSDNVPVSVVRNEYKTLAWGEVLVRTSLDPQGADLWESYAVQESTGLVTETQRWDGAVESKNYGGLGNLTSKSTPSGRGYSNSTAFSLGTVPDMDGDEKSERCFKINTEPGYGQTDTITFSKLLDINGREFRERWFVTRATTDDWSSPNHQVVKERILASGPDEGEVLWRLNADGTLYVASFTAGVGGTRIKTEDQGAPNPALDAVISGSRTITTSTPDGLEQSREQRDIVSNLVIDSWEVLARDSRRRPTQTERLDGFVELRSYSPCCGLLSSLTTREGTTTYEYDALGRLTLETRNGVSTRTTYDAADRVTKVERIGSDSSVQVLSEYTYDLAGRRTSEKDAAGRVVAISEELTPEGYVKTTRTHLDSSTSWNLRYRDGPRRETGGSAASASLRFTDQDVGYQVSPYFWGRRTTKLGANGETYEWVEDCTDRTGRLRARVYGNYSRVEKWDYNPKGQLIRHNDPDGVRTLYAYDANGELSVTALDMDRDDVIDEGSGGTDRVTYTTRTVANKAGVTVYRTTTEVLETDGSAARTVVSISEVSADGLQSWQTAYGQTTHQATVYGPTAGAWTETTTYPDGSILERVYADGRPYTEKRKNSAGTTLTTVTYSYDVFGRVAYELKSGFGTTAYTYHADEQIHTVTTPDPDTTRSGPGYDAQTTTYVYNNRGWLSEVTHPDATQTFTTYWPTGKVKRTWGSRTYPSEYTYDSQGRLKTLTTWQDFAGTTGEAVTTWNYHYYTGLLENKRYADNQGPSYTYTNAGRLLTRIWARGLVTTYAYGNGGDLTDIDYSDGTPDVVHTYDRLGRLLTTTDAAGLLTRAYDSGRLDDETYTGSGVLNGLALTRGLDSLKRPASLGATGGYSLTYGYDQASRLATVTQGTLAALHTYKPAAGNLMAVTINQSGVQTAKTQRLTDKLGRVYRAETYAGTALSTRRDYTYNSANQRTRVEHEDTRRWDYAYDALGQVISADKRLSTGAALPGYAFAFDYDDIGNRTSTTTNGRTATYTPDLLNRYTEREVPGAVDVRGSADPAVSVLVEDELATSTGADFHRAVPLDNTAGPVETTLTVQAVKTTPPPGVATENRPASLAATPESYTYDLDGNLTEDGRWSYTWDGENRLVALELRADVALASGQPARKYLYAYDGQSRRIRKQSFTWSGSAWTPLAETKYLYDGWNLLAEYNGFASNALVRSHAWGLDLSGTAQGAGGVGGLLWTKTTTNTYAAGYDANGNIVAWIDTATGTQAGGRDYGAFGEAVLVAGVSASLPFGFSTKYLDVESDLYYYGFRYYNPSTGRWFGRDPWEERGGLNLYGFVLNNPLYYFDSDGRGVSSMDSPTGAAVAAALDGGAGAGATNIAGNIAAGATAAGVGVGAGAVISSQINDKDDVDKKTKTEAPCSTRKCLPCIPVVGSIAYRVDMTGKTHNGIPTPHSHKFKMNQMPPHKNCDCFWAEILKDPLPGIWLPKITPAAGGGVAP